MVMVVGESIPIDWGAFIGRTSSDDKTFLVAVDFEDDHPPTKQRHVVHIEVMKNGKVLLKNDIDLGSQNPPNHWERVFWGKPGDIARASIAPHTSGLVTVALYVPASARNHCAKATQFVPMNVSTVKCFVG